MSKASLSKLLKNIENHLQEGIGSKGLLSSKSCEQEAMWILQHVLGKDSSEIITSFDRPASNAVGTKINEIVQRRISGEPLQYILKHAYFGGMKLFVDPRVLIPRHETEAWCSWACKIIKESGRGVPRLILDLCTGSGAIALFMANEFQSSKIIGSDISQQALEVARKNRLLNKGLSRVRFVQSDLFDNFSQKLKFDIIFSNPPYISQALYNGLEKSVKDFEPKNALVASNNGLGFYERILYQAKEHLSKDNGFGWLFFEYDQHTDQAVCSMAQDRGFLVRDRFEDLFGNPRAVFLKVK